jgi:hypothetical protein
MKFITVVNKRAGYSHVAHMYSVSYFLILAKYSVTIFHNSEYITYSLLVLISRGILRQNTLLLDDGKSFKITLFLIS